VATGETFDVARAAEQEAALRRVAVLVAQSAPPSVIFDVVSAEAGSVLRAETAGLFRFIDEDGPVAVTLGRWGERTDDYRVGMRLALDGDGALAVVARTGRPGRVDHYEELEGFLPDEARRTGLRAAVAAPVLVEGRVWGAIALATFRDVPFPPWVEVSLAEFAELISVAIAATETREQLLDSRRRLVVTADAERRRLERNLHDGAQQRLVALSIALRRAQAKVRSDPDQAIETLTRASAELAEALAELRELARGLHPAVLSERGLSDALQTLAERAPLPVRIIYPTAPRLPEPVEAAAYFVVAEALTNAARYADASEVVVTIDVQPDAVAAVVSDDGRGGASPAGGTGLRGLADRVEALGGRLDVRSTSDGSKVSAWIPLGEG
jgi:signal transduction histidine kinase